MSELLEGQKNVMLQLERDEEEDGHSGSGPAALLLAEATMAEESEVGDRSQIDGAVSHDDETPVQAASEAAAQERPAPDLIIAEGFEPWHHDLTELGDARRLKDAYAPNLRWVKEKREWIVYHAERWHRDEKGLIVQQGTRQVVDAMREQVCREERQARTRVEARRKCTAEMKNLFEFPRGRISQPSVAELARQFTEIASATAETMDEGSVPVGERKAWVKKCQSRQGLQNMVALLEGELGIAVGAAELDKDPDLLGVANGVVDLRTGQLRPAGRDDLITRTTAVSYNPDAAAPQWEQFLESVMPDPEIRAFLGRAIGYSLTGNTREQCFFLLHGDGSTGKTTLIETIRFILGDYAVGLPAASLTANKQSTIPNDLARLAGARFVPAAETNEFQKMDEALIKRLSGSDTIEARFLNKEFFSFQPAFKLWIATNHLPCVQDTGDGFWRRVIVIPFDQKHSGDADNKCLGDQLKAEAPGILAWAVRQCLEWQRLGLDTPPQLLRLVDQYRTGQDVVARFITARCDVGNEFSAPADQLYQAFQGWVRQEGERDLTGTAFGTRLNGFGYDKQRNSRGLLRCGLKLMSTQP